MSFGSRIPAVAAILTTLAIALGIAASSRALSLADLVAPGASFGAGNGASYSHFVVKIRGKGLSDDLRHYEVVPTDDGFAMVGKFSDNRKGGKIALSYRVAGSDLFGAALAVGVDDGARGVLKVKAKIYDDKKIGKLRVSSKSGRTSDDAVFDGLATLEVKSKSRIRGDHFLNGSGASIDHSVFASVPEPSTALLLAAGLAGLTATSRWRRSGLERSPNSLLLARMIRAHS